MMFTHYSAFFLKSVGGSVMWLVIIKKTPRKLCCYAVCDFCKKEKSFSPPSIFNVMWVKFLKRSFIKCMVFILLKHFI